MKILHIDTSISGEASVSRVVSAEATARLLRLHPQAQIAYRDLASDPIPHLDGDKNSGCSSSLQVRRSKSVARV
ncbi:FMN-dependent NADH-azoreductase [Neorhizobium huautlense]|uniref:FMN-dependent NADH-azoreductase n=1 Tax=Neorhizobium huautlense TaxID=67774 RepID=A0ABT9Q1B1_9HYPH|nr:FMN-dependent NADH-azoreductase [Neorhizobium huautlense]